MAARADADPDAMLVLLNERAAIKIVPVHGRYLATRTPFDESTPPDGALGITPMLALRALFDHFETERHGPPVANAAPNSSTDTSPGDRKS